MFPIALPEINQSNTCSRSLGRWRRPSTLLAVPRMNSRAALVKRYVLAGLSYSEGKTIIVIFCYCCFYLFVCFFFLSFFPFPPPACLLFSWVHTTLLVWAWLPAWSVFSPALCFLCVHASPHGPGARVAAEACLDCGRGPVQRMVGFWLLASTIRENGWESAWLTLRPLAAPGGWSPGIWGQSWLLYWGRMRECGHTGVCMSRVVFHAPRTNLTAKGMSPN